MAPWVIVSIIDPTRKWNAHLVVFEVRTCFLVVGRFVDRIVFACGLSSRGPRSNP